VSISIALMFLTVARLQMTPPLVHSAMFFRPHVVTAMVVHHLVEEASLIVEHDVPLMTVQNVISVIVQYVATLMTNHVVNVRSVVKIVHVVNLTTNRVAR